ncbi:uncharacterized protein [Typha angustifolia]|uniref:uncharacterized protein isoform X3 n=1 Tax=Typha angustifolia TaxID=59011 RepID=UPI003C2D0A79
MNWVDEIFIQLLHLECYFISSGLLQKYQNLQFNRLRHLAVVVDSEEAKNAKKIKQLLCWLSAIGVKYVALYDVEGVLKDSVENDLKNLADSGTRKSIDFNPNGTSLCHFKGMTLELLDLSDGKEGIAKAASFLCSTCIRDGLEGCNKVKPVFTEADMANALKAVGCGGPEPDLLLVYGPARCHLGFPAWRLRYTEIVHMGSLKSVNYGAVVKAIYDFSKKHQNYGS